MRSWKQILKRTTLACITIVIAFSWTRTGRAQAPCLIGRGLDPLDVVNSGVRHNVWIVLDSSGSMNFAFPGGTDSKLKVAKDVLKTLMDELVDAAGRPLVNWAFVHYDDTFDGSTTDTSTRCVGTDSIDDLDLYLDQPRGCVGLKDTAYVQPPLCGGDSRAEIKAELDGVSAGGITPLGVAFTDIAEYVLGQHRPDVAGATANTTNFVDTLLPGQKNFIIQVTDGADTCECNQGGYPPTGSGPVTSPVAMRPSPTDPTVTVNSSDTSNGGDIESFNAGLKGEIAIQNIDPALDGSKGNIFVIGMGLSNSDKQRINTIAWMASGARLAGRPVKEMNAAFFADDPQGLVNRFQDILARIGIPSSEVSLGPSIIGSVKEVIASHTNPAVSDSEVIPSASADALAFRQARQIRGDHKNNVVFSTTVEIPSFRGHLKAHSVYRVTDPDNPRTAREADLRELWDAGVELQDDDPDQRPLFFNRRGLPGLLPFDKDTVTPADLAVSAGYLSELDGVGAKTDSDARDIVVQVVRGYRLSIDAGTGTIYRSDGKLNFSRFDASGAATWKLYENSSGSVAVVTNPPRSPDFDAPLAHASEYGVGGSRPGDGFYWDHINRRTLVYYPSNLGILHGFDAETGAEVVGYLPDDVLGLAPGEIPGSRDTLKDVVRLIVSENNAVVNHKFTLSGAPVIHDAFLRSDHGGDDEWHSVLVFGRGRGGRFISALDVTTVPSSPNNLGFLWNRGNREGIVEGPIDGLGETWSIPVLGNVNTVGPSTPDEEVDQWLVFAGGGYGCDTATNEGQFLYAFRAEDGFIYFSGWAGDDPSAEIDYNALPARPTLFTPHEQDLTDNKDFVTRVYIPDVQGKVHKLDTTDIDPANWTFGVFADMGGDQPITAPVALLNDVFAPDRVFVMAGSGGDRRVDVPVEGFKFRSWVDTDLDGTNTTQFAADSPPNFDRVFNLGERMFNQAATLGTIGDLASPVVFFIASEENFDTGTCLISFTSTLYAVGIQSGQPEFDLDPAGVGEDTSALGAGKAGLSPGDGVVAITRSGEFGMGASVEFWGDGEFEDASTPIGFGQFTLQLAVEGFRISPF